jgi:hypothetical protein
LDQQEKARLLRLLRQHLVEAILLRQHLVEAILLRQHQVVEEEVVVVMRTIVVMRMMVGEVMKINQHQEEPLVV